MSTQSLLRCQERPHLNFPTKLFINNEFVNSSTGATLETVDPASGKGICHVAAGNEEDVAKAVDAAYAAFHNSWKFTDPSTRRSFLLSLADKVAANRQELINMEALDTGKPVAEAEFDIKDTEKMLRYFAGYADKIMSTSSPMDGNYSAVTLRQPVGVVGLIVAWNYPLSMAATKIAAALACGCTIVIKPAENTPLTTLRFAQFAYEVGLPAGVLNVISGYGTIAGAALAKSMKINMISFTGSTLVGKKIMEASAASNMKRVALECGGKSPLVIWKDANMELAVPIAADGIFAHAGQICTASSRLYIHEEIYDVFVEKLCSDARKRTCGDCYSGANLGPIISELQLKKVIEYIEIGKQEGARLLCGGNRVGTEGFFIEPTIFVDVDDNMRIAKEEIFGPVLCIFKFSTMKEVLARCNKSEYGLAAGIFTENIGVAQEFTSKVEAGIVWVNTYNIFDPAQDFGGWKMSGFGREGPLGSIEMFTEKKTVLYATTEKLVKL